MKHRQSRSFEKAVMRIINAIGEQRAAEAVSRSTSLIRKWSDPDNPALPSIAQAFELDREFVLSQKEPAPLCTTYQRRMERIYDEIGPETEPLVIAMFNLYGSVGHLTHLFSEALGANDLMEIDLSIRTQEDLLAQIEKIIEDTHDLEKSVRSA